MSRASARSRKVSFGVGTALVAGLVLTAGGTTAVAHSAAAGPTHRSAAVSFASAPKQDVAKIPAVTYLATMRHRSPGFRSGTARHKSMMVPRSWYGRTSVLPIVNANAVTKRVDVRLARRPNEATTWLPLKAINLGFTRQAILIDLSQRRLYVFRNGKQKYSFPIGIGRPQTPTPTGTFFLAFHAPPNGPEYGPVMLETSAHSTVFRTFEGGNDAIIAIHGPIGSDAAIGTNGAAISNGCIRMHNSQLVKVARVEDGSPIIIVH
jgi:lipoprotein-anchoring transpeptidase ErfK/SrfK